MCLSRLKKIYAINLGQTFQVKSIANRELEFLPFTGCEFGKTLCLTDKFLSTFSDLIEFEEKPAYHTGWFTKIYTFKHYLLNDTVKKLKAP